MKNIILKSILASIPFVMASCSHDWLELSPSDGVDKDTAILTYKDAASALNGVYDAIQEDETYYGARMFYYGDVRGDDMQTSSSGSRSRETYRMRYSKDDAPEIWKVPYNVIRRSNSLIAALESGSITDGTEANLNHIKGQALTVRALAHFDLVRVYGKPYVMDGGAGYGVPIVLEAPGPGYTPGRNTVAEVYEQVEKDLTEAISLLLETKTVGYINKWAAKSLLSRVYLYKNENEKALAQASEVIEKSGYALWSNEAYASQWQYSGTSEHIFEIVNKNTSDWVDREFLGYLMAEDGYGDMLITKRFLDFVWEDPNDVRLQVMKLSSKNTDTNSKDRLYLSKYPGRADNSPQDVRVNNVPVVRFSEVVLNAAEAAVKSGDQQSADKYFNMIYLRANPARTEKTGVTLEEILNERRIELIGEGHRFFDLMRNNMEVVRYTSPADMGNHSSLLQASQRFTNEYFRAILPIPKSECDANAVISKQQNEGY